MRNTLKYWLAVLAHRMIQNKLIATLLNRPLMRRYTKNYVGPLAWVGFWEVERARYLSKYRGAHASVLNLKELREKGFLKIENYYSDELLDRIIKKVNMLYDSEKYGTTLDLWQGTRHIQRLNEEDYPEYERVRQLLPCPIILVPELKQLFDATLIHGMQQYFGSYIFIDDVEIWRHYHYEEGIATGSVFSDDWHVDHRKTSMVKLFMLLDNISEEDGPLHVISKGDTKKLVSTGFLERYVNADELLEDHGCTITRFTGKAGTLMFANTAEIFHRAGNPKPGHRRDMLQVIVYPSTVPLREDWENHVKVQDWEKRKLKLFSAEKSAI